MENEQTLVLIKPDGVARGLIGKIISRFEDLGLKVTAMKMTQADKDLAEKHYPLDEEWAEAVFTKTKTAAENEGKEFPHKDALEFGKLIQSWNMNFLQEGPIIAMTIEGPHAISIIRKIVGHTEPKQADPGTIRSDFASFESYEIANAEGRVLRNLIHASDSPETAQREIPIWFSQDELHTYKTAHDLISPKE
jgi:nucleoside-diphosphate kinase